mgnify:CR=1 FL=1
MRYLLLVMMVGHGFAAYAGDQAEYRHIIAASSDLSLIFNDDLGVHSDNTLAYRYIAGRGFLIGVGGGFTLINGANISHIWSVIPTLGVTFGDTTPINDTFLEGGLGFSHIDTGMSTTSLRLVGALGRRVRIDDHVSWTPSISIHHMDGIPTVLQIIPFSLSILF